MIVLALFTSLIVYTRTAVAQECNTNGRSLENLWEKKLHDDLKNNYHRFEAPPSNETHPITINLNFRLKRFNYNSESQTFSAYTWVHTVWDDPRLTWDPKKYAGIENTMKINYDIWTPHIREENEDSSYEDYLEYYDSVCTLYHQGTVQCTSPRIYITVCNLNLNNWPYDSLKCKLIFSLETGENSTHALIAFDGRLIRMITAEYGTEWDIMDYEQIEDQNLKKTLTMVFTIERHADVLEAMLIPPCILLSSLTCLILLLDVRNNLRVYMHVFCLLCHLYFMKELGGNIPPHVMEPPSLWIYFRGSIAITTLSLIVTFVLKNICNLNKQAPLYLVIFKDYIYNSFVKFLVISKWKLSDSVNSRVNNEWTSVCNVINSVWMYVAVVVYVCLYFMCMPVRPPLNF